MILQETMVTPRLLSDPHTDPFANALGGERQRVRAVIAAVLRISAAHPDVEDATHETLERAMHGRAHLRDPKGLRPWVLGIARHVALDIIRRSQRERASTAPLGEHDMADPRPDPEETLAGEQTRRRAQAFLESLPPGERKALVLFHAQGRSYRDIAEELGVPLGTAATWILRGRQGLVRAMRNTLEGEST